MRTNRIWIRCLTVILSVTAANASGGPVHAQGLTPSAILVSADTGDNSAPTRYLIFGSGGGQPLADLGTTSPDQPPAGAAPRWVLHYQNSGSSSTVEDSNTHQTVYTLPDSADGADLSPSTRYLTYTDRHTLDNNDINWAVHIVDLTNLSDRQFGDTLLVSLDPGGFGKNKGWAKAIEGVLGVDGWSSTETTLALYNYFPESEVQPDAHYLLHIDKLPPSSKPVTPVLTRLPDGDQFVLSPDHNQAAYLSEIAVHDPPNYQPFRPTSFSGRPYDTLRLVDLSSGKLKVVATAAPGAGIDKFRWSADSKRLYYFAGNFADTDYITNPILDYVDLAANKTVKGTPLYTDSTDQLDQVRICADHLYYVELPMHALQYKATLWVTPLDNLSQRARLELPDLSLWYFLRSCIDSPK